MSGQSGRNSGPDEERSRRELADAWYSLWLSWCLCSDMRHRRVVALAQSALYDDVPKLFTANEWNAYVKTLPGFMEYHNAIRRRIAAAGQGR